MNKYRVILKNRVMDTIIILYITGHTAPRIVEFCEQTYSGYDIISLEAA